MICTKCHREITKEEEQEMNWKALPSDWDEETQGWIQRYAHKLCPGSICPRCKEPLEFSEAKQTMIQVWVHKDCETTPEIKKAYAKVQEDARKECEEAEAQTDEEWATSLFA